MEMFNVKRRDVYDFDQYMDLKKPGFGGPKSAMMYKDGRGKLVNQKPKLKEYQRQVERHPQFGHQVYNPTYKAMTHDLVYKQSNKKPFTYRDPYLTALPTIDMKNLEEGLAKPKFGRFLTENHMDGMGHNRTELGIRLINGFVPEHMKKRLSMLYPNAKIKLIGDTIEEVMDAIEFYGLNDFEIASSERGEYSEMGGMEYGPYMDTRAHAICNVTELLRAMDSMGQEDQDYYPGDEYLDNF